MSVRFDIVGAGDVQNRLRRMKTIGKNAIMDALLQASQLMEKEVVLSVSGKRAEPRSVKTGRFRNSITTRVQEEQAIVESDVPYAQFLEYGTVKLQARRHFSNSLARNKMQIKGIMAGATKKLSRKF